MVVGHRLVRDARAGDELRIEHRGDKRLPGRESRIKGRGTDSCLADDLGQGCRQTLCGEDLPCGSDDGRTVARGVRSQRIYQLFG
ncbi:hypothetical protein GCM10009754_78170 [Amycolatopsis minnesotensis]|uniref:Uncharacterized protein n=1 Tax=Amycolatopsis minnesotensis TaxID=337894 RepID=A0ABP5DYW7_9PSEU